MQALPSQLDGSFIFPIKPGTKDPATTHGWKEASNDPAQIERWLRVNPAFNWGVACGMSGLFVVDVDPGGLDWWAKLLDRDPVIKAAVDRAFQVRTPKGGLHVYFRGEGPSTASRIAEGIDTRGGINRGGKIVSGGYVVLPGSKTVAGPGRVDGSYEALPGGAIEALPACIADIVPARKKTDTFGLTKNPHQDQPRNIQTAGDLIAKYVTDKRLSIEGKGGNDLAWRVAASIMDKAISPGMCFDLLWEKWNPHCEPPWDEFELEKIITNAFEHGEDTQSGTKGHQTNQDAFAAFEGMETPPDPTMTTDERSKRSKLQFIHEYADTVGDPEWLLPGTLPRQGVGMLYGHSGSYKTFVALDIALSLAFGVEGQWGNENREKQDVLYFAGEQPNGVAKLRFPAWMEYWGQEFRSEHRMIFKNRVPYFSDAEEWELIRKDLDEMKAEPVLIVIDTLSRFMSGMKENENSDAVSAINFMEQLANYYECFVLFIHHTKKESDVFRGAGALYDNSDVVMSLKNVGQTTRLMIQKLKDADTDDKTRFFKVQPSAASIVLLETADGGADFDPNKGKGKPRADWASQAEVTTILAEMGGSTTIAMLAQTIAGKYGLDQSLVRKTLSSSGELNWLHEGPEWRTPKGEYDL